jgi:hypothetical protein
MGFNSSEERVINNHANSIFKEMLKKRGQSSDDLTSRESDQLWQKARASAEAGFFHNVDQKIDERKERRADTPTEIRAKANAELKHKRKEAREALSLLSED